MQYFTICKRYISTLLLFILLSMPILAFSQQDGTIEADTSYIEIQKKSFKKEKTAELEKDEKTNSDLSSYTFVFYLVYKFIDSFAFTNRR